MFHSAITPWSAYQWRPQIIRGSATLHRVLSVFPCANTFTKMGQDINKGWATELSEKVIMIVPEEIGSMTCTVIVFDILEEIRLAWAGASEMRSRATWRKKEQQETAARGAFSQVQNLSGNCFKGKPPDNRTLPVWKTRHHTKEELELYRFRRII